jgi:hypothetical protein
MAGGWTGITDNLNTLFADRSKRRTVGTNFRNKHGNDGHGGGNKVPYSLGRFLEDMKHPDTNNAMLTDRQRGQFLIDSGLRHWDPTALLLIEATIRKNLTRRGSGAGAAPFDEKRIVFEIDTDPNATRATATVTEKQPDAKSVEPYTHIHIKCPPPKLTNP